MGPSHRSDGPSLVSVSVARARPRAQCAEILGPTSACRGYAAALATYGAQSPLPPPPPPPRFAAVVVRSFGRSVVLAERVPPCGSPEPQGPPPPAGPMPVFFPLFSLYSQKLCHILYIFSQSFPSPRISIRGRGATAPPPRSARLASFSGSPLASVGPSGALGRRGRRGWWSPKTPPPTDRRRARGPRGRPRLAEDAVPSAAAARAGPSSDLPSKWVKKRTAGPVAPWRRDPRARSFVRSFVRSFASSLASVQSGELGSNLSISWLRGHSNCVQYPVSVRVVYGGSRARASSSTVVRGSPFGPCVPTVGAPSLACAPPRGGAILATRRRGPDPAFGTDSGLEAFSRNPTGVASRRARSGGRTYQRPEQTVPLVLGLITVAESVVAPRLAPRGPCACARLSHQEGKTNLSHDGLNPAHVPFRRVNNPTLGEFCFAMIGRADIEGSKSDVAKNAWPPQASSRYPVGPPASGPTSHAYPWVGGLSAGTVSGGGRLYLKPPDRTGAHTLPVVETRSIPGRRAEAALSPAD